MVVLSMENIMCPMGRMTLRNSKMWVLRLFFFEQVGSMLFC